MRRATVFLAVLVASVAQGQSHPTAGAVSRTEHVADFASLPTCDATSTNMQDRHVDDEDARYMCYDFGSGLEWTTVGSGSTLPFVLVDGTTFAQTTDGIRDALAGLPVGGGTIFLTDGTYSCGATTITIPADFVTITANPGGAAFIDCSAAQPSQVFEMNGHDNLTFSGFRIEGEAGGGNEGDLIKATTTTSDSVFDGLILNDSDGQAIEFGGASARNTIRNSSFSGSDLEAIRCATGESMVIADNLLSGNGGDGTRSIHCDSPGATVSRNKTGNTVRISGEGALVHLNEISGGGLDIRGNGAIVGNNTIRPKVGGTGISLTSDNSVLDGNRVLGTSNHIGIDVSGSATGNTVSDNTLDTLSVNAGWAAIHIGTTAGTNFFLGNSSLNNVFYVDDDSLVDQVFLTASGGRLDFAPGFTVSTAPGLVDLAEIGGTSATVVITGELVGPVLEVAENGGGIALEISNAGIVAHPRNIGANPPATCTPGTIFTDLDAADDTNCVTALDNSICLCISANTWVERS